MQEVYMDNMQKQLALMWSIHLEVGMDKSC
jgi:hypothetical protein